jgi:hypothetical protein
LEALRLLLAIAIAVGDGLALGIASGFALEANASAVKGVDPPFENAVLRFLFRRADNLTFFSGVAYLVLIAVAVPVLIALLGLPFIAGKFLSLPETDSVLWSLFGAMVVAMVCGKFVGARRWNRRLDA